MENTSKVLVVSCDWGRHALTTPEVAVRRFLRNHMFADAFFFRGHADYLEEATRQLDGSKPMVPSAAEYRLHYTACADTVPNIGLQMLMEALKTSELADFLAPFCVLRAWLYGWEEDNQAMMHTEILINATATITPHARALVLPRELHEVLLTPMTLERLHELDLLSQWHPTTEAEYRFAMHREWEKCHEMWADLLLTLGRASRPVEASQDDAQDAEPDAELPDEDEADDQDDT